MTARREGSRHGDGVRAPTAGAAPSLGRAALSGRLETALAALEGEPGPAAAWRRAWLMTAAGRYDEALRECAAALEGPPVLQASARMTEAVLHRQVALHARAEVADEEALALLRRADAPPPAVRAAIRIGLVADAVGLGADDRELTRRLRVAAAAVTAAGSWRQGVRLTWVRGEVDVVRGRFARAARTFGSGAKVAADQGALRHQAKSLIFLAAARAALGEHGEARRIAARGLQLAARCGAAPLVWPAELVLAEVDPSDAPAHLARAARMALALVDTLPPPLRDEALQRPPVSWLVDVDRDGAGAAGVPAPGVRPMPSTLGTDA
jgi:tetratricopeptide (TPR) repeat protein